MKYNHELRLSNQDDICQSSLAWCVILESRTTRNLAGGALYYVRIAGGLGNGLKHSEGPLPGPSHMGSRVVTSTQAGFSADFSDEFARPFNAKGALR